MPLKKVRSNGYNYNFFSENGMLLRWGKTLDDNPFFSPLGPELLDVEVSTICSGVNGSLCPWCYKSNTPGGKNMSLKTFKKIFVKIPKNLTQIAFGVGDIDSNPELFEIFKFCRTNKYNHVVPNVTINGWNLTENYADDLAKLCGAVAVSNYEKEICYEAIAKLTSRIGCESNTLKQVNIHQLTALETFPTCKEVIRDKIVDTRLKGLNAIIFLAYKSKSRSIKFHTLPYDKFKELVEFSLSNRITIGMDSCSALKFLWCVKDNRNYLKFTKLIEPCESGLFSLYVNVEGRSYFCSFLEGDGKIYGFDLMSCKDFMREVWFHPEMKKWRQILLETTKNNDLNCRECPKYII